MIPEYLKPFFWKSSYADGDKGRILIPGHKPPDMVMVLNWHTELADCHRGTLLINDEVFQVVGPPGGECVTSGKYRVVMEWSPKFQRPLPELKGVSGRTEIKFHGFNYGHQSEGCIGPGRTGGVNYVNNSWDAVEEIIEIVEHAEKLKQSVWIEIIKREDANMNIFRELMAKTLPQSVEDTLLKLNPGPIVEKVISNQIVETAKDHAANALEVIEAAKDCQEELDNFLTAAAALSEKMKQNAMKTKATYDDKPFAWFDKCVDSVVNVLRGNKPA